MTLTPRAVVMDCDPGNARPGADVDDAVALALLLRSPLVEVRGVTVTAGNVDLDAAQDGALAVLDAANRPDVPVHRGAAGPSHGGDDRWQRIFHSDHHQRHVDEIWHDYRFVPSARAPASHDAAQFLVDQVVAAPGQVTVLATGPLTNLARAIDIHPDFGRLAGQIVVMGGAWLLPDNLQELNFSWDPAAADQVLACGADLTVVPFDVTRRTCLDVAMAGRLMNAATDPLGELIGDLLQRWARFSVVALGRAGCALHDPLTAAFLLDDQVVGTTARTAAVDLHSRLSPGRLVTWDPRTVFAPTVALPDRRTVRLATDVDNTRLISLIEATMLGSPTS